MYMTPFFELDHQLANAETLIIRPRGYPGLPDDDYVALEFYCTDPQCDCRRVLLMVVARNQTDEGGRPIVATIAYAFDRRAEFPGPELDPLNPQSEHAPAILEIVSEILAKDRTYVDLLKRHYRIAKQIGKEGGTGAATNPAARGARNNRELDRGKRGGDSLSPAARPPEADAVASAAAKASGERVPVAMRPIFETIVGTTEPFCREHLDEEYAQLSRQLTAALCRKRPSPLLAGNVDVWACAIIYALGNVNFLWDKTQTPHIRRDELCRLMGVKQSTVGSKVRIINDALNIGFADPRWYRPSRMDHNPVAWRVMVNGLIVDARTLPRELQEVAVRKGLIPYLPGSR